MYVFLHVTYELVPLSNYMFCCKNKHVLYTDYISTHIFKCVHCGGCVRVFTLKFTNVCHLTSG